MPQIPKYTILIALALSIPICYFIGGLTTITDALYRLFVFYPVILIECVLQLVTKIIFVLFVTLVLLICSLLIGIPMLFIAFALLWIQGSKSLPKDETFKPWFESFINTMSKHERMAPECKTETYWDSFKSWTVRNITEELISREIKSMIQDTSFHSCGGFKLAYCTMQDKQIMFVGAFDTWYPCPI